MTLRRAARFAPKRGRWVIVLFSQAKPAFRGVLTHPVSVDPAID
jgi:hypothetical protein